MRQKELLPIALGQDDVHFQAVLAHHLPELAFLLEPLKPPFLLIGFSNEVVQSLHEVANL